MSDIAIKVEGVAKLYQIGQNKSSSFRESLMQKLSFFKGKERNKTSDFWALQDVSFEIKQGEAVGIIGKNGAGKSTLLKILSRITQPTKGRIEINGRVASLLEVGTGFHPELSGRENVYLNGTILGMTRKEIKARFDEIVDFSGVEKFIDTPVKYYSSGMYVRLAFAVAAHLEPEILIIDEVLAVGDAEFQKKCLGKMGEVAGQGRTVIFVSHNMSTINTLCNSGILLKQGNTIYKGTAEKAVQMYLKTNNELFAERIWENPESAPGNKNIKILAVRIISQGELKQEIPINQDFIIEIEFLNYFEGLRLSSGIQLFNTSNIGVLASVNWTSATSNIDNWSDKHYPIGLYRTQCTIPGNLLNEGDYFINVVLLTNISNIEVRLDEILQFTIVDIGDMRKEYTGGWLGVVRPKLKWQTQSLIASSVSVRN